MTPDQIELATRILTRLLMLDDTSHSPDVQEIREVAREILEQQLRELENEDQGQQPPRRRRPRVA
jgi:hypothetical protein